MPKEIYCCCLISPHCSKIPKKMQFLEDWSRVFKFPLFSTIFLYIPGPFICIFFHFQSSVRSASFLLGGGTCKTTKIYEAMTNNAQKHFRKKNKIQRWSHHCNDNDGAKSRDFWRKKSKYYVPLLVPCWVTEWSSLHFLQLKFPYYPSFII